MKIDNSPSILTSLSPFGLCTTTSTFCEVEFDLSGELEELEF